MNACEITKALDGSWFGTYGLGRCPCHADRTPSLQVSEGRNGIIVHCWAGCDWRDVKHKLKARGLLAYLFNPSIAHTTARPKARATSGTNTATADKL